MKKISFFAALYLICANFVFAQRESELRDWSNGYRSAYNTYILKKSDNPTTLMPITDLISVAKELPHTQRYVSDLMGSEKTRILLYSVNRNIIFENYLNSNIKNSTPLAFSISKSLTALAVGVAHCSGKINSLDDKADKYIPRLTKTSWGNSTVRQLLLMNSGSTYQQPPWTGWQSERVAIKNRLIYAGSSFKDYIELMLEDDEQKFKPGEFFYYNNYDTLTLSLIIEAATNQSFSEFFEKEIWNAVGAHKDGAWLRNRKGQTAAYVGFSAGPEDYIRLGHYINEQFNNQSSCIGKYLNDAIKPKQKTFVPTRCYGYQIWSWCNDNNFFFLGYGGQYLVMQPRQNIVYYVHQGTHENDAKVVDLFNQITNHLNSRKFLINDKSLLN
jgi:CubicO group peptidase (beta-lactamase class C family)